MEWVRLLTTYHRDDALADAGEPAEVLFGRALSYSGDQETGGFVSDAAAKRLTPTRTKARTDALEKVSLWERDDEAGGWWIRSWDRIQESHDAAAARRKAARDRQRRHRAGKDGAGTTPPNDPPDARSRPPVTRDVTRDETRDETRDPRDRARANGREDLEIELPADQLTTKGASVDAHEPHESDRFSERTPAQRLAARHAAGVRLADSGLAVRTIRQALDDDGLPEQLVANAIEVLIAEQRECTRGQLRVAVLKAEGNWGPAGSVGRPAGPPTSHLDDLRAAGPGVAEDAFRRLFAVPDEDPTLPELPALEA